MSVNGRYEKPAKMCKELKCRCISGGYAQGEALVCRQPIGFNFGVDVPTGTITESSHPLNGKSFREKILVFPNGKGSTGGSYVLYQVAQEGTAPAAMINRNTETIIAVGAIMGKIPVVDQLEEDPLEVIETGDYVIVDADSGRVTVRKGGDGNEIK